MDHGPKIVLLSLADTVSSGEDRCWCKQETLMRRCGMRETALRGHLKALRGWGLVATNIRRTHTEYVLSIRDDDDTDYSRPSESEAPHPRKTRVTPSESEAPHPRKTRVTPSESEAPHPRKTRVTPSESEAPHPRKTRVTPSESEAPTVEEPVVVTGSIKPGIAHAQPMIPLANRLCLQLSAALKINGQPTTAVSSTHPGMLALVKAIPAEWEDTALAMAPEVVRELVGNGKAGPGLYAYTLAVLKTRMERAIAKVAAHAPTEGGECPHDQIVALWRDLLPQCRQPIKWSGRRAQNLSDRWSESEDRQSLDWWEKFFKYLGESDYLMGKTRHRFSMGLDWIIEEDNFLKALEGGYENGDDNA